VLIPIIAPYTMFEDRRTQLDLRLQKSVNLGAGRRLQANLDLYNIFNANTVLGRVDAYGTRWGQPTNILPGRMMQISAQVTF
jgi:hypothetical protein